MKHLLLILGSNASGKTTLEKDVIDKMNLSVIEHVPKHHTLFNNNIISLGGNVKERKTTSIDCLSGQAAIQANTIIKEGIFDNKLVLAHWSLFTHKSYKEFLSHFEKVYIILLNNSYHESIIRMYKRRCINGHHDLIENGMLRRLIQTVDRNNKLYQATPLYHDNYQMNEYIDVDYDKITPQIIKIIENDTFQ